MPATAQGPHLSLKALLQEDGPKGVKVVGLGAAGPVGQQVRGSEMWGWGRGGPWPTLRRKPPFKGGKVSRLGASPRGAEPLDG